MPNPVNIREIARLSGVSTMTVSRVLRQPDQGGVALPTRRRVMSVVERLKYQPNVHARRLFSRKSHVLGLVIPPEGRRAGPKAHVPDASIVSAVSGAIEAAHEAGYYIMTVVADDAFKSRKDHLGLFRSRSIDAMLVWGICYDEDYIYELRRDGNPFVLLHTHHGRNDVHRLYCDNRGGAAAIAQRLTSLGHRAIGYISGPNLASVGAERRAGFIQVTDAQPGTHVDVIDGDYSLESGRKGAERLLDKNPKLTAIACGNDLMALGVLQVLSERGLRVPEDVSVAGADAMFPYLKPPLTTFAVPMFEMGFDGAKRLIGILEEPGHDRRGLASLQDPIDLKLNVELIEGATTATARR